MMLLRASTDEILGTLSPPRSPAVHCPHVLSLCITPTFHKRIFTPQVRFFSPDLGRPGTDLLIRHPFPTVAISKLKLKLKSTTREETDEAGRENPSSTKLRTSAVTAPCKASIF